MDVPGAPWRMNWASARATRDQRVGGWAEDAHPPAGSAPAGAQVAGRLVGAGAASPFNTFSAVLVRASQSREACGSRFGDNGVSRRGLEWTVVPPHHLGISHAC
jgi:hypothetical protein